MMFGGAHGTPCYTPMSPRRYSQFDVSIAPKIYQRRATLPVVDVTGMSPGLGNMCGYNRDPSTPCFVTPTLGGFSGRRFSFDSPVQTLTALSSAGLPTLNRKAAKRAWAKISPRKWSRLFKITTILLLTGLAFMLFLFRKVKEDISVAPQGSCSSDKEGAEHCGEWESHFHQNKPKEEFMELVSQTDPYHSLESEEGDLWVNRWLVQDTMIDSQTSENLDTQNEVQNKVVEELEQNISNENSATVDDKLLSETLISSYVPTSSVNDPFDLAILNSPSDSMDINPSHVLQGHINSGFTDLPLKHNHKHVLNGVTSYHGNTHYHALPEHEMWEIHEFAPLKQNQINQGLNQLIGSPHQSAVPQPEARNLPVQKMNGPTYNNIPNPNMQSQYYVHPVQDIQQQPLYMGPQPGRQSAPGIHNYNQQQQIHNHGPHIIGHNPHIIGHNPHNNAYQNKHSQNKIIGYTSQHDGYQNGYKGHIGYNTHQHNYQNLQRSPPGVNPNMYKGF